MKTCARYYLTSLVGTTFLCFRDEKAEFEVEIGGYFEGDFQYVKNYIILNK